MALSKKKKQQLKQKAQAQAARENIVDSPTARAAIRQANKEFVRDSRDARGAQRVMVSQLGNMLSNLGDAKGLSAGDRSMLARDFRSRISEAVSGLPYALSIERQERGDAIAEARATLADQLQARQEAAGRKYNSLLDDALEAQKDRIQERKENGGLERGVKNALIIANVAYKNAGEKDQKAFMSDPAAFAAGVAKRAEGADPVDARKAVAILFKRLRKDMLKSTFEGLYGPDTFAQKPKKRAR